MTRKYEFPREPEFPFEGAFPAHGNGGWSARDWWSFKSLTISDAAALKFGMHPMSASDYVHSENCGTLQRGMFSSAHDELIRAVMAGVIRTIDLDKPLKKEDITADTVVMADDVVNYFASISTDEDAIKSEYPEYMSTNLKHLNRAAREFWSTADQDDANTHPINEEVVQWLKLKGFSDISAQKGATIIRPEWATKGRRKNK